MILGHLPEFRIIKVYKMVKSLTSVDQGIHRHFIGMTVKTGDNQVIILFKCVVAEISL
jgi:hypothetical protein